MKYLYLFGTLLIMMVQAYPNRYGSQFDYNVTMNVQDPYTNLSRYFLLSTPKVSQEKTSALIVIHGYADNAVAQSVSDNFTAHGIPLGMAVAYGQSIVLNDEYAWNAGACCGMISSNLSSVDDVGYIKDMMNILVNKYNVDESRIFITGWSNGATMVMRAVCELGDKFKGAAPYAGSFQPKKFSLAQTKGAPYEWLVNETYSFADNFTVFTWKDLPDFYSCKKGHNVPMLIINGEDDIIVPRKGTIMQQPWGLMGMPPTTFAYWNYVNRDLQNQNQAWKYNLSTFTSKQTPTYANKVGNSSITCFQLHSFDTHHLEANLTYCTGTGGHAWWTAKPQPMNQQTQLLMGPNNRAFDLTDNIMKFVCQHGGHCRTTDLVESETPVRGILFGFVALLIILGFVKSYWGQKKAQEPIVQEQTQYEMTF